MVPDGVNESIPAMTSEEERACYYRLAKEANQHGYVVEVGAWLGASSAWIAAGVRDSGVDRKAHIFDRFTLRPDHAAKAGRPLPRDLLPEFQKNLGPLLSYVVPHKGEVTDNFSWDKGEVALLICDAPKRIGAIAPTLMAFAGYMNRGAILAWQDFAFSAAYAIPAVCSRLKLEFVEAVPKCTVVLRVKEPWTKQQVSAIVLDKWTVKEIEDAWECWPALLPPEMAAHVEAGKAMFLCDRGEPDKARVVMQNVLRDYGNSIVAGWQRFNQRPKFVQRFKPLFQELRGLL